MTVASHDTTVASHGATAAFQHTAMILARCVTASADGPAFQETRTRRLQAIGFSGEVERTGIEPVTSWLQTRRSPS